WPRHWRKKLANLVLPACKSFCYSAGVPGPEINPALCYSRTKLFPHQNGLPAVIVLQLGFVLRAERVPRNLWLRQRLDEDMHVAISHHFQAVGLQHQGCAFLDCQSQHLGARAVASSQAVQPLVVTQQGSEPLEATVPTIKVLLDDGAGE